MTAMETYRTLLLDLDGTLVDSNDAHASAWTTALRAGGFEVSFADVRERIGMGWDRLLCELSGLSLDESRGQDITAEYVHLFESVYLPRVNVLPGARDLLARIKHEGIELVLATTSRRDQTLKMLEHAQLMMAFDHIVTADDGFASKVAPERVMGALKQASTLPGEALAIGDTPYDIAAARAAGVAVIGLRSGGWPDSALAGAVAIYADARDLLTHFSMSPLSRLSEARAELEEPAAAE